jgi:DNA-binding transcriptional LysR family regulator
VRTLSTDVRRFRQLINADEVFGTHSRLIKPFDVSLGLANTYWIVCPKATSALPKITAFREWLLAEAAEDSRRLKTLHA